MIARKGRIDRVSIEWANINAHRHIAEIRQRLSNFDGNASGENGKCKYCTYINTSRIGGTMCTEKECPLCNTVMQFGSTCQDAMCKPCAEKNGLCRQCGGDIELKNRRKPYPFQQK